MWQLRRFKERLALNKGVKQTDLEDGGLGKMKIGVLLTKKKKRLSGKAVLVGKLKRALSA